MTEITALEEGLVELSITENKISVSTQEPQDVSVTTDDSGKVSIEVIDLLSASIEVREVPYPGVEVSESRVEVEIAAIGIQGPPGTSQIAEEA